MISGSVQVSTYFDTETFAEIRRFAIDKEISFNEAVRQLVEWGLEA